MLPLEEWRRAGLDGLRAQVTVPQRGSLPNSLLICTGVSRIESDSLWDKLRALKRAMLPPTQGWQQKRKARCFSQNQETCRCLCLFGATNLARPGSFPLQS